MQTVRAIVGADISLPGLPSCLVAPIRSALAYDNPAYLAAERTGQQTDEPPQLSAVDEHPSGVRLPRGAIYTLKAVLSNAGFALQIEDQRSPGQPLELTDFRQALRDYQTDAIAALRRRLQGVVVLPPGSGKTTLGVGAIYDLRVSTLVLVPTRDIALQWTEDVRKLLDVEASLYGVGRHQLGPITVATKDALHHHPELELDSFGLCIFDECHAAPAPSCVALLSRIPARYRLGLTATAIRSDGMTPVIDWLFGVRLLERSIDELVVAGYLVRPRVEAIYTNFFYDLPYPAPHWQLNKMLTKLTHHAPRNSLIVKLVSESDASTLVLTNRTDHLEILQSMLSRRGIVAPYAHSKMPARARRDTIDRFRNGDHRVLLATSLGDQGLNFPLLSRVILALPWRSPGRAMQRLGRLTRPSDKPPPVLYDLVDHEVPNLFSRWLARRSVYRHAKLEINECPTLSLFSSATS